MRPVIFPYLFNLFIQLKLQSGQVGIHQCLKTQTGPLKQLKGREKLFRFKTVLLTLMILFRHSSATIRTSDSPSSLQSRNISMAMPSSF